MASKPTENDVLMESKVELPSHVVYRAFVKETVVLNLQTGRYHGLNPTGGRMLDAITKANSVRAAAATLADEYGRPVQEIEQDLTAFCADLVDRGLIELSHGGGGE